MTKRWHSLQNDRPFRPITLLPVTIAFSSGILMGFAPAPLNFFPLAWVALAPLWVLLFTPSKAKAQGEKNESKRPFFLFSFSFGISFVWGVGYHGLALSWITGLHPLTWLGVPWLASVAIVLFCWGFITVWGAVLVALWAWLMHRLESVGVKGKGEDDAALLSVHASTPWHHLEPLLRSLRRVLLGTALWCGLEWLWSLGPLDWTALAYTQSPGNLAVLHFGQISGATGVTAAIVAVNGLLAEAWMNGQQLAVSRQRSAVSSQQLKTQNSKLKTIALLVSATILFIAVHLLGAVLWLQPIAPSNTTALKVGIIQGNVPTRIKLGSDGIRRAMEGYTNGYLALAAQGVDAVLTPEGALPFLWNEPNKLRSPLYQAVLEKGAVLWLGTFTAQKGGIARSLLTITPNGATTSRYDKIKLVPLGEYIPFQAALGGIINLLSPITENGQPGAFHQQFDTPFGRAIASICYDSAFPEVFRTQAAAGGQFILTASNLDPYSEVLMAQHQAQDIMRAIETDRWAVRATNTGYSSIVDPHGHIEWRSQPRTYQTHAATIFRRETQTLYVRWGDWLTPSLLVLGAITVLFQRRSLRS
ncbi:apolipoprotein N-acyltransferase [Leptolyngbya sp. FACHB-321]|uniref:apolipoprotein N-acyltransferase n=1 Tax=Leptolyngbya sp. FACHB-321 TaxID=2692807 RepID=UPI001689858D|nr:apolipoprotein N-acyltransferase [Leptolyngbya sp. FACHB-321]MBD2034721.1 apolipoprotein N-acyltransferase [Leptolyngbya sp. FACHB-321]